MSALRHVAGLLIVAGIAVAACTGSAASPAPSAAAPGSPSVPASGAVIVGTATTGLGTALTGPDGKTLYIHAGDSARTSTCAGGCATAWPPLTVTAGQRPTAGTGVTGQLGTFTRSDGTTQVTYNGLPLYHWQGDAKPGDTTGQGIAGFSVALATATLPPASGTASPPAPSASGGYGY
ncbi:MAG TPA: hypothetical protein VNF73_14990 [Candidatus Saccharimonadales bacterium]|nr:hypothetical protein [Candidatus Saccharimonadales bacterium]